MKNESTIKLKFLQHYHIEVAKVGQSKVLILLGDIMNRVGSKHSYKIVGKYGEDK